MDRGTAHFSNEFQQDITKGLISHLGIGTKRAEEILKTCLEEGGQHRIRIIKQVKVIYWGSLRSEENMMGLKYVILDCQLFYFAF